MKKLLLLFAVMLSTVGVWAQVTKEHVVDVAHGTGVSSNGWAKSWTSKEIPALQISVGASNMRDFDTDGHLCLFSGTSDNSTYTLSVPKGYKITGYSFDFVLRKSETAAGDESTLVLTVNGTDYNVTDENNAQHVSVDGLNSQTTTFQLKNVNDGIKTTNFKVTVVEDEPLPVFVTTSTAEAPKYYYIASYNRGGVLTNVGTGQGLQHVAAVEGSEWYFEPANENGGLYIVNRLKDGENKVYVDAGRKASTTPAVWYLLKNGVNEKGIVLSSTSPISSGSCIDANNSNDNVGGWDPKGNDWEGTSWVIAPVDDVYNPNRLSVRTYDGRLVNSVSLNAELSGNQTANINHDYAGKGLAYIDLTGTVTMTVSPGEAVTASFTRDGNWTNAYAYIDLAGDGFTAGVGDDGFTPTGDLMTYSNYDGKNSIGESAGNTITMPSFNAPTEPGTYRMRFKQDWSDIEPNGSGEQFMSSGGCIVDVLLEVSYPFEISTEESKHYYGIRSGRDTNGKEWWYTYADDGKISLTQYTGVDNQLWYFMTTTVDGKNCIQFFPKNGGGKVMSYSDTNDGAEKVSAQTIDAESYKNTWLLERTNGTAPYAFKTSDGTNRLSNHGGVGNKMGFYSEKKPSQDQGTAMYFYSHEKLYADAVKNIVKTGLGYPTAESSEYTELMASLDGNHSVDEVSAKLSAYYACEDVEMPVPGKAYYIKAWWRTDGERGMTWNTNMYKPTAGTDGVPFVCQKVGEQYIFVSDNGYYLGWEADGKTGFTGTSYVEGQKFSVEKADLDKTGGTVSADLAINELLGMFCMKANNGHYLMYSTSDDNYHNGSEGNKYYGHAGANTVFFVLAEAEYTGNTVNVNDAAKVGETCVATYCAPYATALPDGYKAYYIETLGEETAQLVELTTDIPANEGVIISGTSGDVTLSLSTQNPAAVATNKLKGVTVATDLAADVASGSVYLLKLNDEGTEAQLRKLVPTEGANTTLAANKAYLYIENESPARFFNFAFDEGTETSIDSLQSETESEKTAIYDLAGRRVQKAQRGLYIINGKKVVK